MCSGKISIDHKVLTQCDSRDRIISLFFFRNSRSRKIHCIAMPLYNMAPRKLCRVEVKYVLMYTITKMPGPGAIASNLMKGRAKKDEHNQAQVHCFSLWNFALTLRVCDG